MAKSILVALLALLCVATTQAFVAPNQPRCQSVLRQQSPIQQKSSQTSSQTFTGTRTTSLAMSSENQESSLPFWLDPNTKGGVIVLSIVLLILPFIGYNIVTGIFGVDEVEAGKCIGVGFTAIGTFAWVATYIFRVATKDMTYVSYGSFIWRQLLPIGDVADVSIFPRTGQAAEGLRKRCYRQAFGRA